MIDFSKLGPMVGAMAYDNYVEFWFKSLTGDSTDSHQIMVPFKDAATAQAVASLVNMETPEFVKGTFSEHNQFTHISSLRKNTKIKLTQAAVPNSF